MINLLPPDLKEQIHYAKLNRKALRYLRITVLVAVVIGVIFGGALYMVGQQTSAITAHVTSDQQTISADSVFLPQAKAASDRLTAIKYIQSTQTNFSAVIGDIANVLPQGVKIDTMTLTGNDQVPVSITMTAPSYNAALAVRDALTTSPRIAYADIETISSTTGSADFDLTVVIAFKPGQAG